MLQADIMLFHEVANWSIIVAIVQSVTLWQQLWNKFMWHLFYGRGLGWQLRGRMLSFKFVHSGSIVGLGGQLVQ